MQKPANRPFKVLESEYLSREPWFTVRRERVQTPSGVIIPDWYVFDGQKGHVTTQIGNAVPPLLAMAMARSIEEAGG